MFGTKTVNIDVDAIVQAESLGEAVNNGIRLSKGRKLLAATAGDMGLDNTACPGEFSDEQYGRCINYFFVRLALIFLLAHC